MLLTWLIHRIVLFVLLTIVIIIFAAIITPKRVWGCHPCCRPELGSGSCFFKLDSDPETSGRT